MGRIGRALLPSVLGALWSCPEERTGVDNHRKTVQLPLLVEMVSQPDAISALVSSPRREGTRIFSDGEREIRARRKAQELALEFCGGGHRF